MHLSRCNRFAHTTWAKLWLQSKRQVLPLPVQILSFIPQSMDQLALCALSRPVKTLTSFCILKCIWETSHLLLREEITLATVRITLRASQSLTESFVKSLRSCLMKSRSKSANICKERHNKSKKNSNKWEIEYCDLFVSELFVSILLWNCELYDWWKCSGRLQFWVEINNQFINSCRCWNKNPH